MDDVQTFKDLVSRVAADTFSKVSDKNAALDHISRIWQDETPRRELLNDINDRKTLIFQIGYCARLECLNNVKKLSSTTRAFRRTMFGIWKTFVDFNVAETEIDINVDDLIETSVYLIRHNFEVWEHERSVWWTTLEVAARILERHSLADVQFSKAREFLPKCIEYFEKGLEENNRKDQYWIAKLLLALVKDLRLLQFSADVPSLIDHFKILFVEKFIWEKKNSSRTVVLEIIYYLFVGFSHAFRDQLLQTFMPLFLKLHPTLSINEKILGLAIDISNDSPNYHDSLVRFLEIFVTCAYPNCSIDVSNFNDEEMALLVKGCAQNVKSLVEKQYSKNIQQYKKAPELVIPSSRLRLVARLFVIQHSLETNARHAENLLEFNSKRMRIETCLEEAVNSANQYYMVIMEEVFKNFEDALPEETRKTIVQATVQTDLTAIRKNGNMNTYVKTLAMLLRFDYSALTNDELKALFNKAINWFYIPTCLDSACLLIENMLHWLPSCLGSEIDSLFDSALKNLCRLPRLPTSGTQLLLYIVRNYDFNECFIFRDKLYSGVFDSGAWQFRRQLITLLLKDTEPDVEFSDVLLSLLFMYPNSIQLEKAHSFVFDEISVVEEDLRWLSKNRKSNTKNEKQKQCVFSTATIFELIPFIIHQVDEVFSDENIDPAKAQQIWRVFTIFGIKAALLNDTQTYFQTEQIFACQEKMDKDLISVLEDSEEHELLALDIGCYWEFASGNATNAMQVALESFSSLYKFIVHWDSNGAPDKFLEEAIKSPRLNNSTFTSQCLNKLAIGKPLIDKLRLLRLYGKYLNQNEYSAFVENVRTDLENETAHLDDDEHVDFLTKMFSREIILSANRDVVDLSGNIQFLAESASPELLLLYLPMHTKNNELLLQWFSQTSNVVGQLPQQTAYFIQSMLKKVSNYKNMSLLLTFVDSVERDICAYVPNYRELKLFIQFLDDFRRGELADIKDAKNWDELINQRSFPVALFTLRKWLRFVCDQLSNEWILHLALTLSTISTVLTLMLKVQGRPRNLIELLIFDLVAIGRCICARLLKSKIQDDNELSQLFDEWINALNWSIKVLGVDWVGFVALDILHDHREEFPRLWTSIVGNRSPFVMKYVMILSDPKTKEPPAGFNEAYNDFQRGTLTLNQHPIIKTQLFWDWLIDRIYVDGVERKSAVQLRLLWLMCPRLRAKLARVLCLFSEETLREKQHKVMERFLDAEDTSNILLLTNLLLFDSVELFRDDVTVALYNSLYQFHPGTVYPNMQEPDLHRLPIEEDGFLKFMVECFVKNSLCFKELQPFSTIALHHYVYGTFALALLCKRLEDQSKEDETVNTSTKVIFNALDTLIENMDNANGLQDYEVFLLSAVCEIFTHCNEINPNLPWIRCLIKAGLYKEAWFYLKYFCDIKDNTKRNMFHLKYAERFSFVRTLDVGIADQVQTAYADIVVALKDDITVHGLPLSMQYTPPVRAYLAELRHDWGVAASLYEEIGRTRDSANALFYLGHKNFDLNNKENYRHVVDLSAWPAATESAELSHPKSIDDHNATLYSLFRLTCRNQAYNLSEIWKDRLKEIPKVDIIYPRLLNEFRDLKTLECLGRMGCSQEKIKLPEELDLGLASTFLLAGWKTPDGDGGESAFRNLFEQIEHITLARVRQLREKSSFQRALSLVKIMEQVADTYVGYYTDASFLEHARLHLSNNELNAAKFLLTRLIKENRMEGGSITTRQMLERSNYHAAALVMVAELSEQKSDEYFGSAVEVANSNKDTNPKQAYECSLKYAKFAAKRYKELDDHTKSQYFRLQLEALDTWANELTQLTDTDDRTRRKREITAEQSDVTRIRNERQKFLLVSATNFMKALSLINEDELIIPYLTAMLIQNPDNEELMTLVMNQLKTVPARVWLPVQETLISYLFDESKPISKLVKEITVCLVKSHPYHSIYPLYFQSATTDNQDQMNLSKRRDTIGNILRRCKKEETQLTDPLNNVLAVHSMFKEFSDAQLAYPQFEERSRSEFYVTKNAFKYQKDLKTLKMVPIPTCEQPLNDPTDCSTKDMITFAEVSNKVLKLGGLSAPKMMQVRGSNGQSYNLIFKPEDLRPDSLVQLLFRLSNIIIKNSQFRKKPLRALRTYNTVPIDRKNGIIECCMNTTSLNDHLVGPGRSGGMHAELKPNELHPAEAHRRLNNARKTSMLFDEFMKICSEMSPVFRYFFYQQYVQPHIFHKHIQMYTDSLALWSIVCYVVGLGDRHLNNILIDNATSELVHIDLGMIFDFSTRALPIPEKVPFRLTRDLVDPILMEGVNSRFKHVAVHAMEQFRENAQVIIGISSLLLHDPISVFGGEIYGNKRNLMAETAISRLCSKLEGKDSSVVPLTADQQVTHLINEARDPKNLSAMFVGWQPHI